MITFVRWFLLTGTLLSFLQATLLFRVFQRWLVEPWLRLSVRLGGEVPAFMRDPRFQRGWPLLMTVVFGTLYWFTGTPAGYAWLQRGAH